MAPSTALPTAYVELCLRLRRLVPALVDAGAVDPALRASVAAEPSPRAADLVREAGRLAVALPDAGLDAGRAGFLAGQLRAVEWRARLLAGQRVPFAVEVGACLDVVAQPGEPDAYRAAHRELAALLPGSGPLAARLAAHRLRDAVPPERLRPAAVALTAALRDRTAAAYGLPVGEAVDVRVVADAPWRAQQSHHRGHRSVVRVNAGAWPGAGRLPRLVAHETYPGHHVECCRLERSGRPELSVAVLGTPQTVGSEGMAECALDVAVGTGWGPWAAPVLATAGVATDGGLAERLDAVLAVLARVRLDAALLLHRDGRPAADDVAAARAHLRRWLLLDDARAERVVDALARPLWRVGVVAAVEGVTLVRPRMTGTAAHRRLLDLPVTPRSLRGHLITESARICDGR